MKKILKFYSPTCGPCKVMTNKLFEAGIDTESIDATSEENEDLVEKYSVQKVPTIVVVNEDGNVVQTFSGITDIKEIQNAIS